MDSAYGLDLGYQDRAGHCYHGYRQEQDGVAAQVGDDGRGDGGAEDLRGGAGDVEFDQLRVQRDPDQ